jgi:hypothetical protein
VFPKHNQLVQFYFHAFVLAFPTWFCWFDNEGGTDGSIDGLIVAWIDGSVDVSSVGWMQRVTDGAHRSMKRSMDESMGGSTGGWISKLHVHFPFKLDK